ncbi:Type I restriction-modification system, specificity subunit S (EC [uncultured Gammaproteobacteria bacterium]|nr:Type I restriction-modification system, specificity subunit S (EC [uncultured Gammaproteobacteria bacterium]
MTNRPAPPPKQNLEQMAETLFRQWFVEEAQRIGGETVSSVANFLNGLACQKFPPKNSWISCQS